MRTFLMAMLVALSLGLMTGCGPADEPEPDLNVVFDEDQPADEDTDVVILDDADDDDGIDEETLDDNADANTTASVLSSLVESNEIDASGIDVRAEDGYVFLTGWVLTLDDINVAVQIAEEASGPEYTVVNELEIGNPEDDF